MEDVSFSYRAKEEIISKINSKPKADVCMMGMLTYCNCLSDDEISFLTENKAVADFFVLNTGRITGNENAVSQSRKSETVLCFMLWIFLSVRTGSHFLTISEWIRAGVWKKLICLKRSFTHSSWLVYFLPAVR